jgi:polyisoprenoid-binding protein YceI
MKLFGAIFAVVLLVITTEATAASEKFILEKKHTYIGFDISYLVIARVSGHFDDFQGSFIINREYPEKNRADIIIKTGSVNTGIKTRDQDIRGPGLFDADRYPTMAFHSKKVELGSNNTGTMIGDLTLLGITKPVTLNLVKISDSEFQKSGKEKSFNGGFKVTGKIKRSDFGMNTYIRPIGNTVTLYVCYNMLKCGDEDTNQKKIKPKYNN